LNRLVFISFLLLAAAVVSYADIPLPNRNIAQSKGMSAGVGFGSQIYSKCRNLFAWTGYGNYSYNQIFSAGASIKFSGGILDTISSIIYQRYSINTMFASVKPKYVLFLGPVFSFENTDLRDLFDDFQHIGSGGEDRVETECGEISSAIGSSIGYQSGIGYLINSDWGVGFGHVLDLTFSGNYLLSLSASVAFNLRERFEKLKENTQNCWLSLEYSIDFTKSSINIHNVLLGFALGF
jgi:hypothetical protein